MEMKQLLSAARAAGYAMALPEDFDEPAASAYPLQPSEDLDLDRGASRALVLARPEPERPAAVRDWIAALLAGRAAA